MTKLDLKDTIKLLLKEVEALKDELWDLKSRLEHAECPQYFDIPNSIYLDNQPLSEDAIKDVEPVSMSFNCVNCGSTGCYDNGVTRECFKCGTIHSKKTGEVVNEGPNRMPTLSELGRDHIGCRLNMKQNGKTYTYFIMAFNEGAVHLTSFNDNDRILEREARDYLVKENLIRWTT